MKCKSYIKHKSHFKYTFEKNNVKFIDFVKLYSKYVTYQMTKLYKYIILINFFSKYKP